MSITLAVDRIALDDNRLVILSCVGYASDIKAMRAALATNDKDGMLLQGCHLKGGNGGHFHAKDAWPFRSTRYSCYAHKLGLNAWHAIFQARVAGILVDGSDDTLWAELNSERFTTPMLRSWLPYIREELIRFNMLRPCDCMDCEVSRLSCNTQTLDSIVETGLKNGAISIKEDAA